MVTSTVAIVKLLEYCQLRHMRSDVREMVSGSAAGSFVLGDLFDSIDDLSARIKH